MALAAAGALAVPATASAADQPSNPAGTQYASGPSAQVGGGQGGGGGGGSLPFTGFDAGVLAAIGAGLVAGGVVLHRRQRPSGERA